MNGTNLLLDTNILIYCSQGENRAIQLFEENTIFLSEISEIELLSFPWIGSEEEALIFWLFAFTHIMEMNASIKKQAIFLRRKYGIRLPDAIIVATAIYLNCSLVTADKQLFKIEEANIIEF